MLQGGISYAEALFCGGKFHSWDVMPVPRKSGIRCMDMTHICEEMFFFFLMNMKTSHPADVRQAQ